MYGYIYKTTNLINGKIYVGQHKCSKNSIDESYIGSGIYLKHAIEYYGKNNFKCEILEWCESLERLNEAEINWISKLNAINPTLGYNLSRGGNGIDSKFSSHPGERNGMFGSHRIGEANPNYGNHWNEDSRKKMRDTIATNGGHIGVKNPMHGKKHSDESKRKMKEAAKNRKPISETSRIKMSNSRRGKKHSDETKLKMSINNAMHKEEYRKKVSEALKGKPSPSRNTKWMHKDNISKMIKLDMIDIYLNNGWLLGRK